MLFLTQCEGQGPPFSLNEQWSGGCQSLVKQTGRLEAVKASTRAFSGGMILSPSLTASAPPGQKSFWTSTTIRAALAISLTKKSRVDASTVDEGPSELSTLWPRLPRTSARSSRSSAAG